MRAKRLDEVVRAFVGHHPDAVVVDMGAGLDGRVFRVDPPPTVEWYDVDLPEVVSVREQVVPHHARARNVAADVTDERWLDGIPADRPAVIVSDGLVPFLPQDRLVSLLRGLTSHFPGGELASNGYPRVAIWATKHLRAFATIAGGVVNPGFDDPRAPERWAPGLTLVEEIFLTRAPELAEMPLTARLAARAVAASPRLSRLSGTSVLRYRF